jgi:hypothetical protein
LEVNDNLPLAGLELEFGISVLYYWQSGSELTRMYVPGPCSTVAIWRRMALPPLCAQQAWEVKVLNRLSKQDLREL